MCRPNEVGSPATARNNAGGGETVACACFDMDAGGDVDLVDVPAFRESFAD